MRRTAGRFMFEGSSNGFIFELKKAIGSKERSIYSFVSFTVASTWDLMFRQLQRCTSESPIPFTTLEPNIETSRSTALH